MVFQSSARLYFSKASSFLRLLGQPIAAPHLPLDAARGAANCNAMSSSRERDSDGKPWLGAIANELYAGNRFASRPQFNCLQAFLPKVSVTDINSRPEHALAKRIALKKVSES